MSHVDDGRLHTFLDGECGEREHQQIEQHLAACGVCRERLEEAKALSLRASELVATLEPDPVHAPSWREIEERAAARARARPHRHWLRPSLASAAVIAIAFGLGWLSRSYVPGAPDLARPAERKAEMPAAAELQADAASEQPLAQDARPAEAEQEAPAGRRVESPAKAAAPELAAAQKREPSVGLAAEADEADQHAAGRSRDKLAEPVAQPPALATKLENEAREASELGRAAEFADQALPAADAIGGVEARKSVFRTVAGDEAALERYFSVEPEAAAVWLGAELRTLPDLQLERVQVGPGSAAQGGGVAGLPAVRLVYEDAAGHEIVLIQQHVSDPQASGADAGPALIIDPSGTRAYRWHDGRGYLLTLIGEVSSDSLRALAERVR